MKNLLAKFLLGIQGECVVSLVTEIRQNLNHNLSFSFVVDAFRYRIVVAGYEMAGIWM